MSDLTFESDQNAFGTPEAPKRRSFDMADSLVRSGLVRSRRNAEYVLLGVVCVGVIGTIILWPRASRTPTVQEIERQAGPPGITITN